MPIGRMQLPRELRSNGGIMSMQGGMKNYLGEQPMVNAPKYWQSRPDKPQTELAYITEDEKNLIMDADIHGSLRPNVRGFDGPNEGPSGIISLDYQGDKDNYGAAGTGYGDRETRSQRSPDSPSSDPGYTTTSPKDHFTQRHTGSGWFGGGNKYGYSDVYMSGPKQGQTKPGWAGRILGGLGSMITGIPFVGGALGSMYDYGKSIFGPKTIDMSQYRNLGLYNDRMRQKAFYDDALYSDNYSDMKIPGGITDVVDYDYTSPEYVNEFHPAGLALIDTTNLYDEFPEDKTILDYGELLNKAKEINERIQRNSILQDLKSEDIASRIYRKQQEEAATEGAYYP